MRPYYEAPDGITIYHGDCRDVLPTLAPGSIDLLLTDPPYGVGYWTGRRSLDTRSSTRLVNDLLVAPLLNDTAALVAPLLNDTAALVAPLLNDTAAMYWFAAPLRLGAFLPVLHRWEIVNVLVWDKGNCTAGDLYTRWGEQWEAIVYARVGAPLLLGRRDRDILRFSRGDTSAYLHPTQKPVELLRHLIGKHSAATILDPFMGSGTTLRAAMDLGRKAIGIEIEERYCEIAARRLEQMPMPLEVAP